MPLTAKGEKILGAMEKEYGATKGEKVFYASRNAGTVSGVDSADWHSKLDACMARVDSLAKRMDRAKT